MSAASGTNGCAKPRESSRRSPRGVTAHLSRRGRVDTAVARSYPPAMVRRTSPTPTDDPAEMDPTPSAGAPAVRPSEPDLATLPITGITRRRAAILPGGGDLDRDRVRPAGQRRLGGHRRAEGMIASNAQRTAEVAGLERELERIGDRRYVLQQARGYGLGGRTRSRSAWRRAPRPCHPTPPARPPSGSAHPPRAAARAWLTPPLRPDRLTRRTGSAHRGGPSSRRRPPVILGSRRHPVARGRRSSPAMIDIPVEDLDLRRLHADRRRPAADHRARRRHPRRPARCAPHRLRHRRRVAHAAAARRSSRCSASAACSRPRSSTSTAAGGHRRDVVGLVGFGHRLRACSACSGASESANPFSTRDLVGDDAFGRGRRSRPVASAASSSRRRARPTSSARPPPSTSRSARTVTVTGLAGTGLIVAPIAVASGAPRSATAISPIDTDGPASVRTAGPAGTRVLDFLKFDTGVIVVFVAIVIVASCSPTSAAATRSRARTRR